MSVITVDQAVSRRISRMFEMGKVPHAMMIISSQALDAAKEIAAAIVCDNQTFPSCGGCNHCRKAKKDIHPDVLVISGKATIQVDQIREMRLDALVLPNDSDRKVYIIDQAQTMTVAAQNAFLKILEQPPTGVYFILAANSRREIIDTIRSRVIEIVLREQKRDKQASESVQELWMACLKRDELQISSLTQKAFSGDRAKAIAFVCDFLSLLNQEAIAGENVEAALALYKATQTVLDRLENSSNVSLSGAYFSILCLEAVF